MATLKAGDHVVCSSGVFGATVQLFSTVLSKFGIETTYADGTEPSVWKAAIRPNTRLLFLETPSNPLTEVFDIAALAQIAREKGALLAVDNCFCTPALQRPFELGADLVIHSATKYLDGQGRVLGGAVLGPNGSVMDAVFSFLRTAGHLSLYSTFAAQALKATAVGPRWRRKEKTASITEPFGPSTAPPSTLPDRRDTWSRMDHKVGAELEGPLQGGRAEAVVDRE